MPHKTRTARKKNEAMKNFAAIKQAVLPMEEQLRRRDERLKEKFLRYPEPPVYKDKNTR